MVAVAAAAGAAGAVLAGMSAAAVVSPVVVEAVGAEGESEVSACVGLPKAPAVPFGGGVAAAADGGVVGVGDTGEAPGLCIAAAGGGLLTIDAHVLLSRRGCRVGLGGECGAGPDCRGAADGEGSKERELEAELKRGLEYEVPGCVVNAKVVGAAGRP